MGYMTHFLGGVSTDVGVRQWLLFLHFLCLACGWFSPQSALGVEILSKSKIEKCEKSSGSNALNCTSKIVVNLAVPSEFVNLISLELKFFFKIFYHFMFFLIFYL